MGCAVAHRANGGIDDVVRSGEIWLADLEMDDAPPLGLEEARVGEHLEGALGPEPVQAIGEANGHDATIMAGRVPVGAAVLDVDAFDAGVARSFIEQLEHALHVGARSFEHRLNGPVGFVAHGSGQAGVAGVADHKGAKADHLHPSVDDRTQTRPPRAPMAGPIIGAAASALLRRRQARAAWLPTACGRAAGSRAGS